MIKPQLKYNRYILLLQLCRLLSELKLLVILFLLIS